MKCKADKTYRNKNFTGSVPKLGVITSTNLIHVRPSHKHLGFLTSENRLCASAKLLEIAAAMHFGTEATATDEPSYDQQR